MVFSWDSIGGRWSCYPLVNVDMSTNWKITILYWTNQKFVWMFSIAFGMLTRGETSHHTLVMNCWELNYQLTLFASKQSNYMNATNRLGFLHFRYPIFGLDKKKLSDATNAWIWPRDDYFQLYCNDICVHEFPTFYQILDYNIVLIMITLIVS